MRPLTTSSSHHQQQVDALSQKCERDLSRPPNWPNLTSSFTWPTCSPRQLAPLFNPRRDRWEHHFAWQGSRLKGLTPVGRVTVEVLGINQPEAVKVRKSSGKRVCFHRSNDQILRFPIAIARSLRGFQDGLSVQLACKRAGVERDRCLAALGDGPLRHSDRGRAERSSREPRRRRVEDRAIIGM